MYDIVVTEFVDQWAVDDLAKDYKVHYDRTLVSKPDELAKLAAESPAIIVRNLTQVRGPVLAAMKNLKVIGRLGVGLRPAQKLLNMLDDIRSLGAVHAGRVGPSVLCKLRLELVCNRERHTAIRVHAAV